MFGLIVLMAVLSIVVLMRLYERLSEPNVAVHGLQLHQQLGKQFFPLWLFMAGHSIALLVLFQAAVQLKTWLG